MTQAVYSEKTIESLNEDIKQFPQVHPITADMKRTQDGVSRLVMLDRYAFSDTEKKTLKTGDFVILTIKDDPSFPARGFGYVTEIVGDQVTVKLDEQYRAIAGADTVTNHISTIDKPLELYYEQIAKRVARGLAEVEETEDKREEWADKFYEIIANMDFVPAGRVLYGAGSETDVTFFNCFVMPFPQDSREGIAKHRKEVMEIMSRGGGVGTNGSTLRPRNTLARGVNGKSSGSVSWLDDIAKLTHLVEQGGSRRGAQMIMLADWHPDIIEFIISKMQNPRILRFIIENTEDEQIRELAQNKLKFTPFTEEEEADIRAAMKVYALKDDLENERRLESLLADGGRYSVHNPEFLSGANISVCITKEFMEAVENNGDYTLRFPDVENYSDAEMRHYNEYWHEIGDVREWELPVKTYRTIKARELWNLINICATYSAEPGIFFIDNANDDTNAQAYGQKVVATNPCGEQPLAPYSVCNLAAVNLANMVDKRNKTVDFDKLRKTVAVGTRMQDNVIDATPYFLEENEKQALGERRIGLGVMGLADMLIYCEKKYGTDEANALVDKVFETIATTAYRTSIELAKEKGSFPYLTGEDEAARRGEFVRTGFMRKMPEDIRYGVLEHGIRNSHLLTVAPTGSTGTMVGVATGLEPYFAFKYYRSGRLGKFMEVNAGIVDEYLANNPDADPNNLPDFFVSSMDLSPEAHADVQNVIQRWVDSSISKTVNAPKGYAVDQVQAVYERLYRGGAKGGTVYVDGSRDAQVLSLTAEENDETEAKSNEKEDAIIPYAQETIQDVKSTNVTYGNEVGDKCPVCREGDVIEAGGCNSCTHCGAQLKCGL